MSKSQHVSIEPTLEITNLTFEQLHRSTKSRNQELRNVAPEKDQSLKKHLHISGSEK